MKCIKKRFNFLSGSLEASFNAAASSAAAALQGGVNLFCLPAEKVGVCTHDIGVTGFVTAGKGGAYAICKVTI